MKFFNILLLDLRLLSKSRNTLLLLVLMPTIIVLILGSVFNNQFDRSVKQFDVYVFNQDMTKSIEGYDLAFGQMLIDYVFDSEGIKEFINTVEVYSNDEGEKLLKDNDTAVFVTLPKNLSSNFIEDKKADIIITRGDKASINSKIVESIVKEFVDRISYENMSAKSIFEVGLNLDISRDDIVNILQSSFDKLQGYRYTEIKVRTENNNPPITSTQYYAIAMITMFSMYTAQSLIHMMINGKKNKTYYRLQCSPIGIYEFVIAKLLGILLVVFVQMTVMMIITRLLYGISWGNILGIGIVTIVYGFSISGITLILGLIAEDEKTISIMSMPIVYTFSFLGGSFIPRTIMPGFVKVIQGYIPNGIALLSYIKMVQEHPISSIYKEMVVLFIMGIIICIVAVYIGIRKGWSHAKLSNNS